MTKIKIDIGVRDMAMLTQGQAVSYENEQGFGIVLVASADKMSTSIAMEVEEEEVEVEDVERPDYFEPTCGDSN